MTWWGSAHHCEVDFLESPQPRWLSLSLCDPPVGRDPHFEDHYTVICKAGNNWFWSRKSVATFSLSHFYYFSLVWESISPQTFPPLKLMLCYCSGLCSFSWSSKVMKGGSSHSKNIFFLFKHSFLGLGAQNTRRRNICNPFKSGIHSYNNA